MFHLMPSVWGGGVEWGGLVQRPFLVQTVVCGVSVHTDAPRFSSSFFSTVFTRGRFVRRVICLMASVCGTSCESRWRSFSGGDWKHFPFRNLYLSIFQRDRFVSAISLCPQREREVYDGRTVTWFTPVSGLQSKEAVMWNLLSCRYFHIKFRETEWSS